MNCDKIGITKQYIKSKREIMIKKIFHKLFKQKQSFDEKELNYLQPFLKQQIVVEEGHGLSLNSKYQVGFLRIENHHAILEDLTNEHRNIKIDFDSLQGAYNGDLVLVKRIFNPRAKFKGTVFQVLSSKEHKILVYKKNNQIFTIKESILLEQVKQKYHECQEGDVFVINSKNFEILEHLGNIEEAKVDERISLILHQEEFRLEESFEVNASMNDSNERVNLTHLPFTTIDPATAKDHDDAIYYDQKEHVLYVAIADVSYFVKENSALDKAAFLKSTSIYLPNKVLPMLPNALSEEMCSLKEGVDRYAYVFKIVLNAQNGIEKSEVFEAIINSHKKFSYGRIDRVLEGQLDQYGEAEKAIFDYLLPLYEVTKDIRAKRLKTGYDFRTYEHRLKLNNQFELESIVTEESTASHQLIEECMLLANIEASKKVGNVGIYRIHEEPSFQVISKLVDDVNILGIKVKVKGSVHETITHIQDKAKHSVLREEVDELIIQSQTQAKYSSKNLGHFGLGFKSYSHFTSPIRRYSDLVLHRMLKTRQIPAGIDDICDHISKQERKVDLLVWDLEARKYARWAQKNIGKEFKAQIVDEERGLAKFYEQMAGLRVVIDNYKGQKLFTKLKVIIKDADVISKKITASVKY